MNVMREVEQIRFIGHGNSAKWMLKQTAHASVPLIDGFGVRVEKIRKRLAGGWTRWLRPKGFSKTLWVLRRDFLLCLDTNQQMKMIFQKAIRKRIRKRRDVLNILGEKIAIVVRADKDIFAIVAARENVIDGAVLEW